MRQALLLLSILTLAASAILAADPFSMNDAVHATFKVFNEGSTATGFVVRVKPAADGQPARYVLASAAHTFERMKGDTCKLILRAPKPDGTFNRNEITLEVRKDGKNLWTRHKDADIAVLDYTPPTGYENNAIALENIATDEDLKTRVPAGTYVRLLCYPAQFEANGAGFPILRHGVIASFPITPAALQKTFMIDFTTFAGDSGGPVFSVLDAANPGPGMPGILHLVGVVISQQWSDEKIKVSDREDKIIRHPFGLGTAVNSHLLRELLSTADKK